MYGDSENFNIFPFIEVDFPLSCNISWYGFLFLYSSQFPPPSHLKNRFLRENDNIQYNKIKCNKIE